MKERPILFSAPMVKAILEGRKTQTRRIVKPQPGTDLKEGVLPMPSDAYAKQDPGHPGLWFVRHDRAVFRQGDRPSAVEYWRECCPYGVPGDRLWVKEAWSPFIRVEPGEEGMGEEHYALLYEADGRETDALLSEFLAWERRQLAKRGPQMGVVQNKLFMPRWASRLTPEVKEVRVQRLQDISTDDVLAEGLIRSRLPGYGDGDGMVCLYSLPEWDHGLESAQAAYRQLYESINGPGSWEANPWVWCVTFDIAAADTTGESTTTITGDKKDEPI